MGKVIKEIIQWGRRRQQWLVRRIHNLTIRQRIICACVAVVLVLAAIIPTVRYFMESYRYTLDDATLHLVGKANPNLASKLTYDHVGSQWQFNKNAITAPPGESTDPAANIPAALKAQIGGGGKSDQSLYAINFPTDPKKGVTIYDSGTQLSFIMVPQFKVHGPKATKDSRLVYPMENGAQLVYTPKNNGMKEDIILPEFIGNEVSYSYKLDLPDSLTARIQADGSVGVFSVDPGLLGNVNTSSDVDAEKLKSAREHAEKNHLLFVIPAPVIAQTGDKPVKATARFGLANNTLTVTARSMDTVQYPASIDPSVVVTSSSDFRHGGNNEGNIEYGTDEIKRGDLTGGSVGSWTTTTAMAAGREFHASAAYNGYVYTSGGLLEPGKTSTDTVYYAALNTDGTIGSWTLATYLPFAREGHEMAAWGGYLYVLGGNDGTNDHLATTSIQYAPINGNGSLGSWSTTASFANARSNFSAVAYNGYLYITGGHGDGDDDFNDVQYAPINADGTLGSWSTTASFSNVRYGQKTTVWNGYMYITGGRIAAGTTYNDIQYAKINADGTLGSWSSLGTFTNARYRHQFVAYGGYLYIIGGRQSSTYYNDLLYAPINGNGSIGKWSTSSSFTTARYGHTSIAANGYLYIFAGGVSGQGYSDVQYARINDPGATTPYTTSGNTFSTTRRGSQTVVYNGYIYVMGGDNGGTPVNTVSYAPINADGTIGTFANTTGFTTNRTYFAAVAANGFMYVIGGCSNTYTNCGSSGALSTVYRGTIASNGTIGSWTNTNINSLPAARYGLAAVVYNNAIYAMGGLNNSTFTNTVYSHPINTSNGNLSGAWVTDSVSLPSAMAYMKTLVYGGKLYLAGGCTAGATSCTTTSNTVYYTGFDSSNNLSGNFASTGTFATARGDFGFAAVNNHLYIAGGRTNTTYYSDTQSAPINTDGTVGAWSNHAGTTLATARYGIGAVAAKGNIYVAGGYNGTTYYNNVQIALINNGGNGGIGNWTVDSTDTLATARSEAQTVAYNGYLYALGGRTSGGTALNSVEYAPLNNDGTVGAWQTTSSFTTARATHGAAAMNDYMYIIGGRNSGGGPYYKDIQYARINNDGSLGAWASAGSNVYNGGQGVCMVAHNGYIYSLGGYDGSTDHTSVRYAVQNSNGTIGAWQTAPDFTNARSNTQCLAYGDHLYMSGGEDANGKNDVQLALINSNGSIGSWQFTQGYNSGRANHALVAYNGYMYVMGGVNSTASNTPRGDAQYAPINPNGTLGEWQHTTSPGSYNYADVVIYNGYVYLPAQNSGSYLTTTLSAPLVTIPRLASYSKVIDIGEVNKFTGITYGGTLPGGALQINYRTAGEDGVFGSPYNLGRPPSPEGPCIGTYGTGRYIWISLTLDDTSGITSNITDITTIYESVHPAANIRLHGGKTLQSGTLSALDTCGVYS